MSTDRAPGDGRETRNTPHTVLRVPPNLPEIRGSVRGGGARPGPAGGDRDAAGLERGLGLGAGEQPAHSATTAAAPGGTGRRSSVRRAARAGERAGRPGEVAAGGHGDTGGLQAGLHLGEVGAAEPATGALAVTARCAGGAGVRRGPGDRRGAARAAAGGEAEGQNRPEGGD